MNEILEISIKLDEKRNELVILKGQFNFDQIYLNQTRTKFELR